MPHNRPPLPRAAAALALMLVLLAAPALGLMLLYGQWPNTWEMPAANAAPLFTGLLASNPAAALRLLFTLPLAVVAYVEAGSGLRVWEAHLYALPAAVLAATSIYAATIATAGRHAPRALAGSLLVALALAYVRVAACCTAPGWALDIWLRGRALTPAAQPWLDWTALYTRLEAWFVPAQVLLVLSGLALLAYAHAAARPRQDTP